MTGRRLGTRRGCAVVADDVRLAQITDSTYRQSLPGHVLGYGSVRVESAGQTQAVELLDFVPHPQAIYRATLP